MKIIEKQIRLIIADIDGTLISKGNPNNFPPELKEEIRQARKKGVLFSLASGRDLQFMEGLRSKLISPDTPREYEAILYEDICLKLANGEFFSFGGLEPKVLELIKNFYYQYPEKFRGLTPLPDNRFTIRTSWVTEEFANNNPTNTVILQRRYPEIKELIESIFTDVEVKMSADAIDAVGKGADKVISFKHYLKVLEENIHLLPSQVLTIGDAKNDEQMLKTAMELGGKAGFVGDDIELERRLRQYPTLYISIQKGPRGTVEAIRHFIN